MAGNADIEWPEMPILLMILPRLSTWLTLPAQSTPLWRFSRHSRRPCGDSVDTADISYAAVSAETADITESATAGTADDVAHNIHIFMLIPGRFLLRRQTMNIFSGHRRHSGDSIDAAVATNADRRRLMTGQ